MAIAVPFIMASMGASTTAIAVTSVAFSVTGINDKINKAAANVFGEDLVKFANIAGMAYGSFSDGGFDLSGAASSAAEMGPPISAMEMGPPVSAMEMGPPISAMESSMMDADLAGGLDGSLSQIEPFSAGSAADGAMQAMTGDAPWAGSEAASAQEQPFNLKALRDAEPVAPMTAPVQEMATSPQSTGATSPVATAEPMQAAAPQATATQAAAPQATAEQAAVTQPAVQTPQYTQPAQQSVAVQAAKPATTAPVSESFIDKLIRMSTDPKTGQIKNSVLSLGGDLIKGVASGYTAAQQRQQYDDEIARRDRLANLGAAGWVQRR